MRPFVGGGDETGNSSSGAVGQLLDKSIVVTGAAAGIGEATVRALLDRHALVTVTGRNAERGRRMVDALDRDRVQFVTADAADTAAASVVVDAARERFGGLDGLVNNAGRDLSGVPLLDTPEQEVRDTFDVNFFGALAMLRAAARAMAADSGGAVVNVTSRLAVAGVPTMGLYGASKGALLSLTRAAAVELAPLIRVNAVAPGLTETPLVADWLSSRDDPAAAREQALAGIPQRRFATPDDVASAIVFLVSDEASHITGASLAVDGGYTAA